MDCKEDCFHLGAKALIQNTYGKLLILQKNATKPHLKQLWDLPGGRIHRNESLEDALKREVFEETGLKNIAQINPFTTVLTNIRIPLQESTVGLILTVYLCSILESDPQIQLSEEHLHYVWVPPKEAAEILAATLPIEFTEKVARLQKAETKGSLEIMKI